MIDRALPAGDLFKFIDLTFKVFWPIIALGWMAGIFRARGQRGASRAARDRRRDIADPRAPRRAADVRGAARAA
jgi:hypothetical protein